MKCREGKISFWKEKKGKCHCPTQLAKHMDRDKDSYMSAQPASNTRHTETEQL